MKNPKIGLGSVQWGLKYGISNNSGQTPDIEIASILNRAREHGVRIIDTACLYGDAENRLGQHSLDAFQMITKRLIFRQLVIQRMLTAFCTVQFVNLCRNFKYPSFMDIWCIMRTIF
ncbi:MAG: hypothetical protein HC782_05630 [Gammaproteobacteria bacterium]|nr:hypothetical protein [Gammaproteobacteria bacterium]